MALLRSLLVCACWGAVAVAALPDTSALRSVREAGMQYLLPLTAVPTSYVITLITNIPTSDAFTGTVKIAVAAAQSVAYITLHKDESLTLTDYQFSDTSGTIELSSLEENTELQTITFYLTGKMTVGTLYSLTMKYSGTLADDMYGFYRSSYEVGTTESVLAATQFEPNHARKAFPCWDEPKYKATFTITITHNSSLTALSNTKGTSTTSSSTGTTTTVFAKTNQMSTYLVAFVVSDFTSVVSNDTATTTYSVWVRSDQADQATFAAEIGVQTLYQLQTYVGIKLNTMLSKLDLAAIPDFSAGAMENWGLITFRETALMYQASESTESAKESVALVIAHEQAHMWFGDLVTPEWWSYIWLNEGFARYFQYVSTDLAQPTWRVMDTYIVETLHNALKADSLSSSHPMTYSVYSPTELQAIFDNIEYDKGSAILHMTRNFMGDTLFQTALTNYLTKWGYSTAKPYNLFGEFDNVNVTSVLPSGETCLSILDTWTSEAGYPLVTVQVSGATVNVTQKRFYSSNSSSTSDTTWWVPLTYTTQSSPDFINSSVVWLDPSVSPLQISITKGDWIIFNLQQQGFYRVNYDTASWQKITNYLKNATTLKEIHLLNRAQLLDDALTLAKSGALAYSVALDLTQYLENEVDPIPWKAAIQHFTYINNMITDSTIKTNFNKYMLSLLEKVYQTIGFNESSSDDHLTKSFRSSLLTQACKFGHAECVKKAATAFSNLKESDTSVDPNARSAVYCTALRNGSTADWQYLWKLYTQTTSANDRVLILGVLGCTTDENTLTRYLEMTLTPNSSAVRAQDASTVFSSVLNGNPENFEIAYSFLMNNIDKMMASSYSTWSAMRSVITGLAALVPTKAKLTELETFLKANEGKLLVTDTDVSGALESAQSNLAWRTAYTSTVSSWLAEAEGSTGSGGSSAFSVSIPVFLLIAIVNGILFL